MSDVTDSVANKRIYLICFKCLLLKIRLTTIIVTMDIGKRSIEGNSGMSGVGVGVGLGVGVIDGSGVRGTFHDSGTYC